MKAVISSTYSDVYLFFIPIVCFTWNRLGVDVVCFLPNEKFDKDEDKLNLIKKVISEQQLNVSFYFFDAPGHKASTYAQCLRNYAAAIDGLDENELICSSDVDMVCFKKPPYYNDRLTIWGYDLVPDNQVPMCYITGTVTQWKEAFDINGRTYQKCIDDLLGDDECEHYRGNRWSRDQEVAYNCISQVNHSLVPRAREGTSFAKNRLDRDDAFILDRLHIDNEDYHLNRPGYEQSNFEKIIKIFNYHYPANNFEWIKQYCEGYKKLL